MCDPTCDIYSVAPNVTDVDPVDLIVGAFCDRYGVVPFSLGVVLCVGPSVVLPEARIGALNGRIVDRDVAVG